jgi:hypothetical protein
MGRAKLFHDFDPYDELVRLRIQVVHQQEMIQELITAHNATQNQLVTILRNQNEINQIVLDRTNQKS